jgi:septum formation protein
MNATLILASSSPRRRELLTQAGYKFSVEASSVAEVLRPEEDAVRFATRLAREKAQEVFTRHADSRSLAVLGADTVVVCDREIMGKPRDAGDAIRILSLLSGRTHQVVTGAAVVWGPEAMEVAAEVTHVTMRTLAQQEIADYVASGEPMDKAGAYAIQGLAGRWIPRISGCYFNVVGLPLALVASMLEAAECRLLR